MKITKPQEQRPDYEAGTVGTGNDARLSLYEQIADSAEQERAEDLTDITDDMYLNPAGTGEDEPAPDNDAGFDVDEEAPAESADSEPAEETPAAAALPKLKVLGEEVEITPDLIARAQKITAADTYLAEAARIYKEYQAQHDLPQGGQAEPVDDLALARAIQMGTEDEAVKAIQQLRTGRSLSKDEVMATVQEALAKRDMLSDADRFKRDYKDLLADDKLARAVWAFDRELADEGLAANYDRFKQAAEQVQELRGTKAPVSGLDERRERIQSQARPVQPNGARRATPAPEPEETPTSVIAAMAKARGQSVVMRGR